MSGPPNIKAAAPMTVFFTPTLAAIEIPINAIFPTILDIWKAHIAVVPGIESAVMSKAIAMVSLSIKLGIFFVIH